MAVDNTYVDSLSEVQSKLAESKFSTKQILIVLICLLVQMVDGFDVVAIAMAAPSIAQEWSMAPEVLGYVLSAELIGMTIGVLFISPFSDKYGRRRILLPSIFVVTVSTLLTAYSSTSVELIATRLLTGLGVGGVLTSIATLASEFSPQKYRAAVATIVTAGGALGSMVGAVIADYCLTHFDWQMIFLIGTLLGVVILLLFAALVPESVEFLASQPSASDKRLNRINHTLKRLGIEPLSALQPPKINEQKPSGGFSQLVSSDYLKLTLLMSSIFFCLLWAGYFVMKWFPTLLSADGFDTTAAVYALTVFHFGGLTGSFLISVLSTRYHITGVIGTVLVFAAITLLAFTAIQPATVPVLYIFIFLLGASVNSPGVAMYSLPVVIFPTRLRALGLGLCIGVGRAGAIASPVITGYLVGASWGTYSLVLFVMLPAVLAALVMVRLLRSSP